METKIRDRGWVKNVAIVFLSVMLVLTFFSNTIMNRSLPEVATQSISSNTITAQVRGTGRVSATQNYEVKIDQTRTVKSVMVKVGQEVNAGDVLFVLSDMESDELEAAQDSLRALSTSYQKALINATESDYARENREIQRARENLTEAENERDSLIRVSDADVAMAEANVDAAKDRVTVAQRRVDRAREDLEDLGGRFEADDATVRALRSAMDARQDELDAAENELETAMLIYGAKYREIENEAIRQIMDTEGYKELTSESSRESYIEKNLPVYMPYVVDQIVNGDLQFQRGSALRIHSYDEGPGGASESEGQETPQSEPDDPAQFVIGIPVSQSDDDDQDDGDGDDAAGGAGSGNTGNTVSGSTANEYKTAYDKITSCKDKVAQKETEYENARYAYREALSNDNTGAYSSISSDVKRAEDALREAQEQQTEAEEDLAEIRQKKAEYDSAHKAALETVKSCQSALEDLMFNLQEQQKTDSKNAQLEKLDLQDLAAQVGKAQRRVNELASETVDKEIKAEVPGIIESISITAGNKTTPDTPLATIELPDMGYTMSFSVTNEQARLIHTGDTATVSNYYYGSRITATVANIKTDPKNPQTSKLVTFDLSGDVNVGSDLTVSVGQRSQEYDFVVPNSALRSDSNGDFVLIITAKNSPLGNRYIATRVDVTKIASDDTSTAVTGALNRGDFVITTSTKPIENGQQVRMQDT